MDNNKISRVVIIYTFYPYMTGLNQVSKTEDLVVSLQIRPQRLVISVSLCASKQTPDPEKKYKLRSLLNLLLKKYYNFITL